MSDLNPNVKDEDIESTLKDGKPSGVLQNILAKMYPIILGVITLIVMVLIRPIKFQWRFIVYLMAGSLFGWTWNWFTVIYDPLMPGWLYHPWAILGWHYKGMVFEDFVFYTICGALFYLIRYYTPDIGVSKKCWKYVVLAIQLAVIVLATFIFAAGGKSISLWFAIPGVFMLWLSRETWNLPRFFIVGMFVVLFGSNWDTIVTTIIPSIPGFAWASEWVYIAFNDQGLPHHSTLWLAYKTHRWAWVGNVPIEIMYWFNISGWWFIYGLASVICKKDRVKIITTRYPTS
jgi:hypothetical protein